MIKNVKQLKSQLKGEITIPPDKSISHRAVMLASLAKGKSIVKNFSTGADCKSTLEVFKMLGTDIKFQSANTLEINGGNLTPSFTPCCCGNSGTTMRLTAGILAGQKFDSVLTGDKSLSKRPMGRIIKPLTLMGALIDSVDGHAPLVTGCDLNAYAAAGTPSAIFSERRYTTASAPKSRQTEKPDRSAFPSLSECSQRLD